MDQSLEEQIAAVEEHLDFVATIMHSLEQNLDMVRAVRDGLEGSYITHGAAGWQRGQESVAEWVKRALKENRAFREKYGEPPTEQRRR